MTLVWQRGQTNSTTDDAIRLQSAAVTDSTARAAPPNYAARRMLVSAAVITAIVVAASVVWQSVRGDDPPAVATPATWNAIAFVAGASGDTTLVDADGTVIARYDGDGRVSALHAAGSTVALVHSDSVTLLDVGAGATTRPDQIALPERTRTVSRLATARDRLLLAAGNRNGGAVRVIDGATGGSYDLADLAGLTTPLLYTGTLRVDPDGTTVAVADASSFQTIVVSGIGAGDGTSDAAEPRVVNFAAQPLAVDARLLATTQVVGGRADVTVHPLDGPASAPVPMGIPAGGVFTDGRLLAVTTDGSVVAIRVGDRQPRQLATLAIPTDATVTGVFAAAGGERIVIHAGSYVGVIDADGRIVYEGTAPAGPAATTPSSTSTVAPTTSTTVATTTSAGSTSTTSAPSSPGSSAPGTGAPATAAPIEPIEPIEPSFEWHCLPVALGTPEAALISLTDGVRQAALPGVTVTGASADGCTVVGTDADRTVVVGAAGRGDLGTARNATLSPDGRAVLVSVTSRDVTLVPLADDLQSGTPIDVSASVPRSTWSAVFVER